MPHRDAQTSNYPKGALVALLLGGAAVGHAQDDEPGIVRGPVTLLPELSAAIRYDDNIYQSDAYKIDSLVTLLGLGLGARYETANAGWEVGYRGDAGVYEHNSDDNFFDQRLNGRGILQLALRHRLELSAGFEKLHEDRGSNLTQGLGELLETRVPEPDEYDNIKAAAKYEFGAKAAQGRLQLDARYNDKDYSNNRERTQFFSYDQTYLAGTFFWRVFPKSSLLLQGSRAEVSYPSRPPRADHPQQHDGSTAGRHYLGGHGQDHGHGQGGLPGKGLRGGGPAEIQRSKLGSGAALGAAHLLQRRVRNTPL